MGNSAPPPTIPGMKAERPLQLTLQKEVATLLGRDNLSFPGAQPVSFAARHLLELQKQDYYVCEKSDGIRCLMYMTNDGASEVTYLIDRKNDYYYVQSGHFRLHFPLPDDEQLFHTDTLLDGELVNDMQGNGVLQLKYLVFDCLTLDKQSLMHRTLDKRLAYYRDKAHKPFEALYQKYPEEIQYLPFIVEFKKMEFAYSIDYMFREVLPNLPHGNDGLIFTCRNSPYKPGTDPHILKWKKETENSIDFLLNLHFPTVDPDSEDEREGIYDPYPDYAALPTFTLSVLLNQDQYKPYSTMHVEPSEWESMKSLQEPLDDRIVECYQNASNRWRFMRFRDDKKEANHISTVESVIESIQDKISERDLIANQKKIRDEWKRRDKEVQEAARVQREFEVAKREFMEKNKGVGVQGGNGVKETPGTKRKLEDAQWGSGNEAKRKVTPQPGP
ncbi:Dcp1p-Dcp2p decapping enzyme complex alpha subunit [Trapelia coarctata]|nr:Dcp1p-Dcp2p decapping enzyme complex alpha subunit [Trapelia coarctata]